VILVARELARRVLLDVDGAGYRRARKDLVRRGAADALRCGQGGLQIAAVGVGERVAHEMRGAEGGGGLHSDVVLT